jgi:putative ABC transport system substrate-binding protein
VTAIVDRRPHVIVAQGGLAARVILDAGIELPVVYTFSGDPVLGRVADSYARPGRNRTGITFFALELAPKRLELMKEAIPSLRRLAILSSPLHAGEQRELEAAVKAATALGLAYDYHPAKTSAEIDAALDRIARARADGILAFADALVIGYADRIAAFSARTRIPAVSGWEVFAERGNLMSYGPKLQDSFYRLATFVDRIVKGTRAGDIPIEFPKSVELVINRRAAQAMDIAVPASLLARADRVID